jgi:hypothetical protein
MKIKAIIVAMTLVLGLSIQAFADTTSALNTEASRMNTLATNRGESHVVDKISGDFNSFLGSDAKPVVSGLRNGTPITLVTTAPGSTPIAPPVTTTTIITPPTGKMGFGNAYISLALAKQQLNQVGITQPTPEQLQAALTGGTVTTGSGATLTTHNLQGVLTMRSQNMGWGQIAQKLGTKLGPVVSGMKSANQNVTTVSTSPKGTQSSTPSGSGIVSGSGTSHGNSGHAASGQNRSGAGIVSGSGRSTPGGNAYGRGIVSGSGQGSGGNSGITTAGGHGNSGQAKGHGK